MPAKERKKHLFIEPIGNESFRLRDPEGLWTWPGLTDFPSARSAVEWARDKGYSIAEKSAAAWGNRAVWEDVRDLPPPPAIADEIARISAKHNVTLARA